MTKPIGGNHDRRPPHLPTMPLAQRSRRVRRGGETRGGLPARSPVDTGRFPALAVFAGAGRKKTMRVWRGQGMSSKIIYHLNHPEARRRASETAFTAPDGWVVTYSEPKRSLEQNAILHALCGDIARQKQWAGCSLETEDWKRLVVDLWCRTEGGMSGKMVPSLDYAGVVLLGHQTRSMTKKQLNELIEFIYAWGSDNGITWSK